MEIGMFNSGDCSWRLLAKIFVHAQWPISWCSNATAFAQVLACKPKETVLSVKISHLNKDELKQIHSRNFCNLLKLIQVIWRDVYSSQQLQRCILLSIGLFLWWTGVKRKSFLRAKCFITKTRLTLYEQWVLCTSNLSYGAKWFPRD